MPVQAEFYALEGLGQLLETMKLVRKNINPTLDLLGVLPTMINSRTSLSQQVYEEIKQHFPGKVFKQTIPRNIRFQVTVYLLVNMISGVKVPGHIKL